MLLACNPPKERYAMQAAIWMNGRLVDADGPHVSAFDHGLLYGDGVFEGIRFYSRRAFRLEPHLQRLERSAAAIRLELPYTRADFGEAIRSVIEKTTLADGYLRLVVTRGDGELGLDPRSCRRPNAIVLAAPLRLFADGATHGVDVVIASTRQSSPDSLDPRVKSLNYLNRIMARIEASDAGASEAILLDHSGHIAEGTGDNLFVVRDGVLATPRPTDGALEGITRDVVVGLARTLGIEARETSLSPYDLVVADEAFLTGTGAGLVPIRAVGGRRLQACPGPIFRRIEAAFTALVRDETGPRAA
jgi:branched-chain amino acid aminotransferase